MTTTDEPTVDRSDWYVQVTAPGVPYSAIRVAFNRDAVADAVLMCKYLAQEWDKAFAVNGRGTPPAQQPEEPHYEPFLGDERDTPAARQDARPVAPGGAVAYCPEHNLAAMRPSAPQFNKDGDKFYHPLPESDWHQDARGGLVKNHTLYWRLTVDEEGHTNNGKVVPQLAGASR